MIEPSLTCKLVIEWDSQLDFMAVLEQLDYQPLVLKLEPRPELFDALPGHQQITFVVGFLIQEESLGVYHCEELIPPADDSRFFKNFSIDKAVLGQCFWKSMSFVFSQIGFLAHKTEFSVDDLGENEENFWNFIVGLLVRGSENVLLIFPVYLDLEETVPDIRKD
jgi:hypothetical protein